MDDTSDDSDGLNADIEDADIFETLGRPGPIPEQAASDELPMPTPPPETTVQDIQSEAANPESSPLVVIDSFSHGSAGVPISDGPHADDTDREESSFTWAPFGSQCDWEVAHWAKMRGPTSSAMADLLAIPEV